MPSMKLEDHILIIFYCLLLYGRALTYLGKNLYFLLLRQGMLAKAGLCLHN